VIPCGAVASVVNELKPEPVKVTVDAADPAVIGVVELEDVMTGATTLVSPMPKAFGRLKTAPLLPVPVLVKVRPQTVLEGVAATTTTAEPAVGLVIVVVIEVMSAVQAVRFV
jgi:hypothetical protein